MSDRSFREKQARLRGPLELKGPRPPGLGLVESKNKRIVVVGFADGHVASRNVNEMFRRDVNYTGSGTDEPGVLGRDFP